jgi:hypothetical protein
MKKEISMKGKTIWSLGSILFFIFSGSVAAAVPEGPFSHNYDIGTLTSTPYENLFNGTSNLLQHSYTFDLEAPATVKAHLLNIRPETGDIFGFPPLTHILYKIDLFNSENQLLVEGTTTNMWSFGSTLEAEVSGELPAGKDYFVLVTGNQQNDIGLSYITTISVVPEPETYAMLLAGLGVVGAMSRRKKRNS